MKKSIYEIIIENIQETGKLSDDFDLKKSLTGFGRSKNKRDC